MENKNLFLDDIREPRDACYYVSNPGEYWNREWTVVRSYDEFVNFIQEKGLPETISFDHDLADEHYQDLFEDKNWKKEDSGVELSYDSYTEKTGLECAKWLVDFCIENGKQLPTCWVHSANPVGKKNIQAYLENAAKHMNL